MHIAEIRKYIEWKRLKIFELDFNWTQLNFNESYRSKLRELIFYGFLMENGDFVEQKVVHCSAFII